MVLESNIENDIKYLYFNDEASLNAISSGDWKSLKSEIESFEIKEENKPQVSVTLKYFNGKPVIKELKRISKPSLRKYS